MQRSERNHWIREQQMAASLGMISSLCEHQCRAIAAACLRLRRDPIYEDVLGLDAKRLALATTKLLEEPAEVRGTQVLVLAITRKLVLQILDRKEVIVWMARDHPETLSILLAPTSFDCVGVDNLQDDEVRPRLSRGRRRTALPRG